MKQIVKKIWNITTTFLIIVVAIFSMTLVVPKVLGVNMYVILSGSMEPSYQTGGVVFVEDTDRNDIKINDVVTYRVNGNTIVTHRVVDIVDEEDEISYITKGDANSEADNNCVYPENIIGKVMFTIPYLGYAISYIQQPPGMYVAIALGISVMLMMMLSDLIFSDDKKTGGETHEQE